MLACRSAFSVLRSASSSCARVSTHTTAYGIERASITISLETLNSSYKSLFARVQDSLADIGKLTVATGLATEGWLWFTGQTFGDSVVAISAVATAVVMGAREMSEMARLKTYLALSLASDSRGLSTVALENDKVKELMRAGGKAYLTSKGLKIIGGKEVDLSTESLKREVGSVSTVIVPDCVLTKAAARHVDEVTHRWFARINFPLSVLNMLLRSEDEDHSPDDLFVMLSSSYNLYDFLTGKPVEEAQNEFDAYLKDAKSPEELLRSLVQEKDLEGGGMSFMIPWIREHKGPLSVRVDRAGRLVLEKYPRFKAGGPFPEVSFPKMNQLA